MSEFTDWCFEVDDVFPEHMRSCAKILRSWDVLCHTGLAIVPIRTRLPVPQAFWSLQQLIEWKFKYMRLQLAPSMSGSRELSTTQSCGVFIRMFTHRPPTTLACLPHLLLHEKWRAVFWSLYTMHKIAFFLSYVAMDHFAQLVLYFSANSHFSFLIVAYI